MNWRAATRRAVLAQLTLVVSACQSARQEPKPDPPRSGEVAVAEVAGDRVQSSVLQVRERSAAGEPGAAPAAPSRSFVGNGAAAPALAPAAPASATRSLAASPSPALGHSDAERFGRLKAAIERANAEVERSRPRTPTESGAQIRP